MIVFVTPRYISANTPLNQRLTDRAQQRLERAEKQISGGDRQ
jgi:hypothetical protein